MFKFYLFTTEIFSDKFFITYLVQNQNTSKGQIHCSDTHYNTISPITIFHQL